MIWLAIQAREPWPPSQPAGSTPLTKSYRGSGKKSPTPVCASHVYHQSRPCHKSRTWAGGFRRTVESYRDCGSRWYAWQMLDFFWKITVSFLVQLVYRLYSSCVVILRSTCVPISVTGKYVSPSCNSLMNSPFQFEFSTSQNFWHQNQSLFRPQSMESHCFSSAHTGLRVVTS